MSKPYADIDQIVYHVRVWEPQPDVDDIPLVEGLIALNEVQKADLFKRLERLDEDGIINSFDLEQWDPQTPSPITVDGIYNVITGDLDHKDEDMLAVWNGVTA